MRYKFSLCKTYSSLSVVKKSIIWYTTATVLQKGMAFLTTPILTRMLSDSQYGLYSVYQSWLQIVSVISVVALDRCVTVGFMKYDNDRPGFLSSIQLLMTITTIVLLLVVLLFHTFFSKAFGLPLLIIVAMFITAIFSNALSNWAWYQRYEYNYKQLAICMISFAAFTQVVPILVVAFFRLENKGEVLILSNSAMIVVLYGIIYITVFLKGKVGFNRKYWSFALPYSFALIPHALAQILLNSSSRIMIDKLCSRADVAYYGVTYNAAMVLNIIVLSVSSAMQPWYFSKIKAKDIQSIREKTNQFLLLAAVLSVFVSVLAPEILSVLAPPSYKAALWIFPSVAAAVFFNSMYLCFANFESYYEKPVYFSIATITGAALNIILNIILIPLFGFVAAGYTTLVSYILFSVMHYIFMKKICKEKLNGINVFDRKFILILSLIVIILSTGLTILYGFPLLRYYIIGFVIFICTIQKKRIHMKMRKVLGRM